MNSDHCSKSCKGSFASIASNASSSSMLTSAGELYQAGLVNNSVQPSYLNQQIEKYVSGKVVDVVQTECSTFVLTSEGRVYEYNHNESGCETPLREIFFPIDCSEDPVVSLSAGRKHIVMLTASKKAYGYGDNSKYQLVPAGECWYSHAVRIDLSSSVKIGDCPTGDCPFVNDGVFTSPSHPDIPDESCGSVSIANATPLNGTYTASFPILIDGNITACTEITFLATAVPQGASVNACGSEMNYTVSQCVNSVVLDSSDICYVSGNTVVNATIVSTPLSTMTCFTITGSSCNKPCSSISLCETQNVDVSLGTFNLNNNSTFTIINAPSSLPMHFKGKLCVSESSCPKPVVSQPCVVKVSAGGDSTALADDKGRVFVLGDVSSVRDNSYISRNNKLYSLLSKTDGTVKFSANELQCGNDVNNKNCVCPNRCVGTCNKLDLSKFEVELKLDSCPKLNVCDFLKKLNESNEPRCDNTCEPCDNTIYVKYQDECDMPNLIIASRDAVSRALGYFNNPITGYKLEDLASALESCDKNKIANFVCNFNFCSGRVDFSNSGYSVDCGSELDISKFLVLKRNDRDKYNLVYVDVKTSPQAIQFVHEAPNHFNVKYSVPAYKTPAHCRSDYPQVNVFSLVFGGVIPAVERNNYRAVLANHSFRHSIEFKNPINNKLLNTYVKGGDYICIEKYDSCHVKLMSTFDVPSVYCLNKRVLDLAVGDRSVYVVATNVSCPNEVYVLGNNCFGQLGLCNNLSTLCMRKVNRCYFDCNVSRVFASSHAVAFLTSSGRVYVSGHLEGVVDCNCPKPLECCVDRVSKVSLNKNNLMVLTHDGNVHGVGSNQYGQLGTSCKEVSCSKLNVVACPKENPCAVKCEKPKKSCCSSCSNGKACESKHEHPSKHVKQVYRRSKF